MRSPRLFVYHLRQDDPRKCTASRLIKRRLALNIARISGIPRKALVLNPFASLTLSPADREGAANVGICVIDCSWERATEVFERQMRGENRRLPFVLAGNPTSYSKLGKLSSAEAFAGTLWILGFPSQAWRLLSEFSWGETFLTLNQSILNDYANAKSSDQIANIEQSYFPMAAESTFPV